MTMMTPIMIIAMDSGEAEAAPHHDDEDCVSNLLSPTNRTAKLSFPALTPTWLHENIGAESLGAMPNPTLLPLGTACAGLAGQPSQWRPGEENFYTGSAVPAHIHHAICQRYEPSSMTSGSQTC